MRFQNKKNFFIQFPLWYVKKHGYINKTSIEVFPVTEKSLGTNYSFYDKISITQEKNLVSKGLSR